jgi:hypothetical protein
LELVIGGTRRQVPSGTIVHFGQERNSVAEPGHCSGKSAMEALQSSRSYLGVGGCHEEDISNSIPRMTGTE